MPEVGHIVQFQWLPVDNISSEEEEDFGYAIALTQNGQFSGWIIRDDRQNVTSEMWKFKWRVSEIYSEFYFRKGGGNSRRAYISQTKETSNKEERVSDESIESMKVVYGKVIRGVVVKEEAIEDIVSDGRPDHPIKQEDVAGAEGLVKIGVVRQEDVHGTVIKAEEIDVVNQEEAHEIVIKAESEGQ